LSNNFTFNRWILNNSATGDVILSNVVVANLNNFNGPNPTLNQTNPMDFITNISGNTADVIITNNGFIYAGDRQGTVRKYSQANLVYLVGASYGGAIETLTTNNGFIYVGGTGTSGGNRVQKLHESNLTSVGNTANYTGPINAITVNNGFIYAGGIDNVLGAGGSKIYQYNESTLAFVNNSANFGGRIVSLTTNNGFLYAGGQATNRTVQKFHENNLVRVGNTPDFGSSIKTIAINNGFIYVGGGLTSAIKYNESTLQSVGGLDYGGSVNTIGINNGFVFLGGSNGPNSFTGLGSNLRKYYENNLTFIINQAGGSVGAPITSLAIDNGLVYVSRDSNLIRIYREGQTVPDNRRIYSIEQIKE
jgi:hypothetical protein